MRVYVSGPYTAPTGEGVMQNVTRAIEAGIVLMKMGHEPLVPHLMLWLDRQAQEKGITFTYEDWMRVDLAWMMQADAVLWLSESPGANTERHAAERAGIPVYTSLVEVPAA
jgi:hypothetical protein